MTDLHTDPPPRWLEEAPDPIEDLPVVTSVQTLPLERLTWENYERLCLRLARCEAVVEHCQLYGERGQAQQGIDIYARRTGSDKYIVYQCKRVDNFSADDLKKAVQKFRDGTWAGRANTLFLCTQASLLPTKLAEERERQARELANDGVTFRTWDREQLSLELKSHPEIVADFFGEVWVAPFCDPRAAHQWQGQPQKTDIARFQAKMVSLSPNSASGSASLLIIPRPDLHQALGAFAATGSGVVVGTPGVGKSYALRQLHEERTATGEVSLFLPIDQLEVETEVELNGELGLKTDLIDYVHRIPRRETGTSGVLIFDTFDSARSERKRKMFLRLIRRAIEELGQDWRVIVSVRAYDARRSEELLDLFPNAGRPTPADTYQSSEIACRHLAIPRLTPDEAYAAASTVDHLAAFYEHGSNDFREMLRTPFNLWLLGKILARDPNPAQLSGVRSEVELLALFWEQRVVNTPSGETKQVLLTRATAAMVERTATVARKTDFLTPQDEATFTVLLSAEVIVNASSGQTVVYPHNILFDYAVSILLIEDDPRQLEQFILTDVSRTLFLRPSLDYYFTRLWHTRLWHTNRILFWEAARHLRQSDHPHLALFARLLPTTVIVNEAREIGDLSPLIAGLDTDTEDDRNAVLSLLHALRTLPKRRIGLWSEFIALITTRLDWIFAWDAANVVGELLQLNEEEAK